jgi:hypothetical protein
MGVSNEAKERLDLSILTIVEAIDLFLSVCDIFPVVLWVIVLIEPFLNRILSHLSGQSFAVANLQYSGAHDIRLECQCSRLLREWQLQYPRVRNASGLLARARYFPLETINQIAVEEDLYTHS